MQTINYTPSTNDVLASLPPVGKPTIHQTAMAVSQEETFLAYDNGSIHIDCFDDGDISLTAESVARLQTFLNGIQSTQSSQLAFSMSRRQFIAGYNAGVRDAKGEQFCHEQPLTDSEIMVSIKLLFESYNKTKDVEGLEYSIGSLIGLFAAR